MRELYVQLPIHSMRRFLFLAALILPFAAPYARAANPGIDSISPAVLTSSPSPQTVTITGHDFSPGATVYLENLQYGWPSQYATQVTVVSSTTINFVIEFQTSSTLSWSVHVRTPSFSSAGVPWEMRPQLSEMTPMIIEDGAYDGIGYDAIIHARVTPHSTAYLLYNGSIQQPFFPQFISGRKAASDDDGDGVVEFDLATPAGTAFFYVVDSAGVLLRATPGIVAPPPSVKPPDVEVGPGGAMSRVVAEAETTLVLWVRPGAGAWVAGATDNNPVTDAADVPFLNGRINILTTNFTPLGASGQHPDVFASSDVLVLLGNTAGNSVVESSGTLPSPLTGTLGGGSIHVTVPVVIGEGNSGTVYLERWGGASGSISVTYRLLDGTAVSGTNYVVSTGSVTFAPGEYVKPISISTIDDGVYDRQKFFTLEMTPHGTSDDTPENAQIFLNNRDPRPLISISDLRIDEGDSGSRTIHVPVTLTGPTRVPANISWVASDGSNGTLQFAPGETSQSIPITYIADTLPEADRKVTIFLYPSEDATVIRNMATVTIADDDTQSLSVADTEAEESSETATFLITMSRALTTSVTVHYATFDGTATAPLDYAATSGTLTFEPGEIAKTVSVPVVHDQIADAGETFTLRLSGAAGATIAKDSGTATILDSDRLPQPVVLIDDISVAEGNAGTTDATFDVRLSFASALPVVVAWKTENGSAHDDSDYTSAIGTLTFAPGETALPVTVKISGDTTSEPNENFRLIVIGASNAIAGNSGTCTIINDDGQAPPPRRRAAH
jgi:hypothetical protein